MAFLCTFQLNNGEIQDTDEVIFLAFVDDSFGHFHEDQVKIARVLFNGDESYIYSTCPCIPSDKASLTQGQKIDKDTIIGYFAADDIPYDKPFARIER